MAQAHVLTLEQMRVMSSPVRQRIIAAVYARGDCSIAEIAESMERKADTLYHHVRLMVKAGLLQKVGERVAGKNREAVYGPVAPMFAPDRATSDPAYLAEFARMIRNNLATAAANHARAYADLKQRNSVLFETANVRLTSEQVEELNAELRKFFEKVKAESNPDGQRHFYVFLSTPVGPK